MPDEKNDKVKPSHDLLGAALGLFALIMLISLPWQVDTSGPDPFYKGPMIFPLLVLTMMVAASLPFWKRLLRLPLSSVRPMDGGPFPWKTARVLGLLVLYLAALVLVGLEIATVGFLLAALWVVGERSWAEMIFVPAGTALVLYLLFKLMLDIWFPTPLLVEWVTG